MDCPDHAHPPTPGVDRWVQRVRRMGFTPVEALEYARELEALASPLVFSPHVATHPMVGTVSSLHQRLRGELLGLTTPAAFVRWREAWATRAMDPALSRWWMVLAMGEEVADLELRRTGQWHGLMDGWMGHGWDDVTEVLCRRRVFGELGDPQVHTSPRLADVLQHTGLRSVRWGYFENPALLPGVLSRLVEMQQALASPLAWTGPVMGLGGETGLVLSGGKRTEGAGQVFLDGGAGGDAAGQQLYLDTWDVLPHEWAHTLDSTLARHATCARKWATLAILDGMPDVPTALETALDGWWRQVIRVQFDPVPEAVHRQLQQEIQAWPERILNALGDSERVCRMVESEMDHIARHTWTQQDSAHGWKHFFDEWWPQATLARRWRTALLVSGEIALALRPADILPDEPMWAGFLQHLAGFHPEGLGRFTDGMAYLANPVELMARSFEVAFQENGVALPLWGNPRREAGLVYPLEAERAWQRAGWQDTLAAMTPWWEGVCERWYLKQGAKILDPKEKKQLFS
jgi:hypothetical protein